MQSTKEDVLRWIDHDPNVSTPDHQITGLGMCHALKFMGSGIKIGRTRVGVVESGAIINRMYDMRTITFGASVDAGVERSCDHSQAVIRGQCPRCNWGVARADIGVSRAVDCAWGFRFPDLL